MNTKKRGLILVLILLVILLSSFVYAQTVSDFFRNGLISINDFFANEGYEPFSKVIDYVIFSLVFISLFTLGAKKAFGEYTKPVQVIVIIFGLVLAFVMVIADISIVYLIPYAYYLLYLILFVFFYWLLGKLGMESKAGKFFLSLLLLLLIILLVSGIRADTSTGRVDGFLDSFTGLFKKVPGVQTPEAPGWAKDLFKPVKPGEEDDKTPTTRTCGQGEITRSCECGGRVRNSGYCCSRRWQDKPCGTTPPPDGDDGGLGWWWLLVAPLLLGLGGGTIWGIFAAGKKINEKRKKKKSEQSGVIKQYQDIEDSIKKYIAGVELLLNIKEKTSQEIFSIKKEKNEYIETLVVKGFKTRFNKATLAYAQDISSGPGEIINDEHKGLKKISELEHKLKEQLIELLKGENDFSELLRLWEATLLEPLIQIKIQEKGGKILDILKKLGEINFEFKGLIQQFYNFERAEEIKENELIDLLDQDKLEDRIGMRWELLREQTEKHLIVFFENESQLYQSFINLLKEEKLKLEELKEFLVYLESLNKIDLDNATSKTSESFIEGSLFVTIDSPKNDTTWPSNINIPLQAKVNVKKFKNYKYKWFLGGPPLKDNPEQPSFSGKLIFEGNMSSRDINGSIKAGNLGEPGSKHTIWIEVYDVGLGKDIISYAKTITIGEASKQKSKFNIESTKESTITSPKEGSQSPSVIITKPEDDPTGENPIDINENILLKAEINNFTLIQGKEYRYSWLEGTDVENSSNLESGDLKSQIVMDHYSASELGPGKHKIMIHIFGINKTDPIINSEPITIQVVDSEKTKKPGEKESKKTTKSKSIKELKLILKPTNSTPDEEIVVSGSKIDDFLNNNLTIGGQGSNINLLGVDISGPLATIYCNTQKNEYYIIPERGSEINLLSNPINQGDMVQLIDGELHINGYDFIITIEDTDRADTSIDVVLELSSDKVGTVEIKSRKIKEPTPSEQAEHLFKFIIAAFLRNQKNRAINNQILNFAKLLKSEQIANPRILEEKLRFSREINRRTKLYGGYMNKFISAPNVNKYNNEKIEQEFLFAYNQLISKNPDKIDPVVGRKRIVVSFKDIINDGIIPLMAESTFDSFINHIKELGERKGNRDDFLKGIYHYEYIFADMQNEYPFNFVSYSGDPLLTWFKLITNTREQNINSKSYTGNESWKQEKREELLYGHLKRNGDVEYIKIAKKIKKEIDEIIIDYKEILAEDAAEETDTQDTPIDVDLELGKKSSESKPLSSTEDKKLPLTPYILNPPENGTLYIGEHFKNLHVDVRGETPENLEKMNKSGEISINWQILKGNRQIPLLFSLEGDSKWKIPDDVDEGEATLWFSITVKKNEQRLGEHKIKINLKKRGGGGSEDQFEITPTGNEDEEQIKILEILKAIKNLDSKGKALMDKYVVDKLTNIFDEKKNRKKALDMQIKSQVLNVIHEIDPDPNKELPDKIQNLLKVCEIEEIGPSGSGELKVIIGGKGDGNIMQNLRFEKGPMDKILKFYKRGYLYKKSLYKVEVVLGDGN